VVLKLTKSAGPWGCQRSAIVAEANGLGLLGQRADRFGRGPRRRHPFVFHA